MRLLIFTQSVNKHDTNLGFFHEWLVRLAAHVEELTVVALSVGEYDVPANVRVLSLGKEQYRSRLQYLWRLWKYLLRFHQHYDRVLVHMNPEYVVLFGWWWCLSRKKIFLWYVHRSVDWKLVIAELFVHAIFTASPESCRIESKKIQIAGHGVDSDFFSPGTNPGSQQSVINLLSIGRITPRKDILFSLMALKQLHSLFPGRFKLDIVGDPVVRSDFEYYRELKEFVTTNELQAVVHFLGGCRYEELPGIYRAHQALIHTSRTGSIDKVVLEALASGLTVFSSSDAYANWPDFVIKFPPGDAVALGRAVQAHLLEAAVPIGGREYVVKNFNLSDLISRIVAMMK